MVPFQGLLDTILGCGLVRHLDQLLAEILAREQAEERFRHFLEAFRDVFAIGKLAVLEPSRELPETFGITIDIIEDEEALAGGLKFNFEQEGYEVLLAGDGPRICRSPGALEGGPALSVNRRWRALLEPPERPEEPLRRGRHRLPTGQHRIST